MSAARFLDPIAPGMEGCERTGATTAGSVIIASANPPVKHIPTAPTPGPPHRSCSKTASALNQSTTGELLPVAHTVNSRLMHARNNESPAYISAASGFGIRGTGSRPGSPNSTGSTAEQPIPATMRANASTFGVIPGISAITITAGPVPAEYTTRSTPSCSNTERVKPASAASSLISHLRRADVVERPGGRLGQAGQEHHGGQH